MRGRHTGLKEHAVARGWQEVKGVTSQIMLRAFQSLLVRIVEGSGPTVSWLFQIWISGIRAEYLCG